MLLGTFKRVTRWGCLKTNVYLKMMMTRLKTQICVFYRNLVEAHKILLLRIIPRQRKRPLTRTPAMVMMTMMMRITLHVRKRIMMYKNGIGLTLFQAGGCATFKDAMLRGLLK